MTALPSMAEFAKAMEKRNAMAPITFVLLPSTAVEIIGQLQLALRHPNNAGPSAEKVRQFCDELIRQVTPDPTNPIHKVLMAGYDPAHDEPPDD